MSNTVNLKPFYDELTYHENHQYPHLETYYDKTFKAAWVIMNPAPKACYTSELLNSLLTYQCNISAEMEESNGTKYDFLILASKIDNIFNLGGDLILFSELIKNKNRESLLRYAKQCINAIYQNIIHLDTNLTTIALVQGDALGGGFEAALSANVLIAEKGTKFGFPEVLFNLFPGMGAYSLLSRKVQPSLAEEIILTGRLFLAEELYDLGIVNILAEKGQGKAATYEYIKKVNRNRNTFNALRQVKDVCNPITYKELHEITTIWVDYALKLTQKDLKMMRRLAERQNNKAKLSITE